MKLSRTCGIGGLSLVLLLTASVSHAGLGGFIIGYAIGSSGNKGAQTQQPILLKSDVPNRDVIICYSRNEHSCWWGDVPISPELYAGRLGYRTIYTKGMLIVPSGDNYIVMEVSR